MSRFDGEVKLTPFNMKEELEEGRFDKDGHYLFNKNKDATDNWLDNIDWVRVKTETDQPTTKENKTLGDSDSEDSQDGSSQQASGGGRRFDEVAKYKEMLTMMQPKETVKRALQRLGVRISSAERWKRKKMGIVDDSSEKVTKLTELANEILTNSGNMNVYEESYETIERKIKTSSGMSTAAEFDMFGDEVQPAEKMEGTEEPEEPIEDTLMWEFKWAQDDGDDKIFGPYNTEQMQNWVVDGYFKDGVFVRKCGAKEPKFYTSNRIDFELYL